MGKLANIRYYVIYDLDYKYCKGLIKLKQIDTRSDSCKLSLIMVLILKELKYNSIII